MATTLVPLGFTCAVVSVLVLDYLYNMLTLGLGNHPLHFLVRRACPRGRAYFFFFYRPAFRLIPATTQFLFFFGTERIDCFVVVVLSMLSEACNGSALKR